MTFRISPISLPRAGILLAIGFLVYQNSLFNDFVYDDTVVIVENYFIKHAAYLPALVDKSYFDLFGEKSYRPIVSLSYFLDHYLWGLSSQGFHFTNLLLHLANTGLFFIFLSRLFEGRRWVFFAALLFTLHPVMTESVNSISFREELLTVLCTFSGLICFLKARASRSFHGRKSSLYLLFTLLFFAVGLLSKESMVMFPALAGLVCLYLNEWKWEKPRMREYGFGMAILLVLYLFIRFYWLRNEQQVPVEIFSGDLWVRAVTGVSIIGYYLKLFLFPFPLTPDYTFPQSTGVELIRAGVTFLILVFISFQVWVCKDGGVRFGWLWFLFSLAPTLNIYPIANPLAERYLYLPSCGIYVVFAAGLSRYPYPAGKWRFFLRNELFAGQAFRVFVLLCFAVLTLHRNFEWKDADTLWQQAYKATPNSFLVLNNLGISYNGKEDYAAAIRVLKKSLQIHPTNVRAYSNLGLAYRGTGNNKLAIETLKKGLDLDPADVYVLTNLGKLKIETDAVDEGLEFLGRAIEARPHFAEPFLIMGNLYTKLGRYEQAFESYRKAAANRPDYPEPWINIGVLRGRWGQFEKSVEALHKALRIGSNDPFANLNLALAYYFLKDYENAGKYAKIAEQSGAVLPNVLLSLLDR